MEVIDLPLEGREDREGLIVFLKAVAEAATEENQDKLASISLRVRGVDPLAVLESIYEPAAAHFYLENRSSGWAVAGAEAVDQITASGADRFARLRQFASHRFQHTVAIGELGAALTGPVVFTGCTFEQQNPTAEAPFPAAWAFIPQWQVARTPEGCTAVANARILPGMDILPVADRIWSAHHRFTSNVYQAPPPAPPYRILAQTEVGPPGHYQNAVQQALAAIQQGHYEKIVLARALDLQFDNPCSPLRLLDRLRTVYPDCHCFSLQNQAATGFIGASPERLLAVRDHTFFTEAIAGSAPRGPSSAEDQALGRQLLESDKDRREHQHVVHSILRRLDKAGLAGYPANQPNLLRLANVQHLRTPISGPLPTNQHLLDLAAQLHPTPAVGGTPRSHALPHIPTLEPFPRGLFTGLLGWFDAHHNGDLVVGLRSALIQQNHARLYAGAGIVQGSLPQKEFEETSLKMKALLQNITAGSHLNHTPS